MMAGNLVGLHFPVLVTNQNGKHKELPFPPVYLLHYCCLWNYPYRTKNAAMHLILVHIGTDASDGGDEGGENAYANEVDYMVLDGMANDPE